MLMANVRPTCETNIIRYPSKIKHYMLQVKNEYTRTTLDPKTYPNFLVRSTKKPSVQIPTAINQSGMNSMFPPRRPKSGIYLKPSTNPMTNQWDERDIVVFFYGIHADKLCKISHANPMSIFFSNPRLLCITGLFL